MKGIEVRVELFEVSAMRNEILSKDETDDFMDVVTQGTIRAVTRLKVDKEHCGNLATTIYESDRKNNLLAKVFNRTTMTPGQVEESYLTLVSYSKATCNACLTKDR
ncbi:hypothetical protein [Kluyvera georgiana]|uniref:hypothetical protein n=1 Tax=Kluyvera georgiana TaxID=73098 RepID=UPI00321FCE27